MVVKLRRRWCGREGDGEAEKVLVRQRRWLCGRADGPAADKVMVRLRRWWCGGEGGGEARKWWCAEKVLMTRRNCKRWIYCSSTAPLADGSTSCVCGDVIDAGCCSFDRRRKLTQTQRLDADAASRHRRKFCYSFG
ncbi:hypothetical protein N665_0582s0003 [Sinapis alba]|nr:hypothetical protein N665_0582s0003 [Sinapis alba]